MTTAISSPFLLVFGGVCGNWQAFEALLAVARRRRLSAKRMVITGDLVAYCADGERVVDYCRRELSEAVIVRGNCERTVADDAADCGCGFVDGSVCDRVSAAWFSHAKRTITPSLKRWMGGLPRRVDLRFGDRRLAVFHATEDSDNAFVFASSAVAMPAGVDGVVSGHSGIPFTRRMGDGIWHNSGSLGMPANDGTARVWYSLWRLTATGEVLVVHRPLSYDAGAAAARMRDCDLPEAYRKTLVDGIWPDDAILPEAERRAQGRAIRPRAYLW